LLCGGIINECLGGSGIVDGRSEDINIKQWQSSNGGAAMAEKVVVLQWQWRHSNRNGGAAMAMTMAVQRWQGCDGGAEMVVVAQQWQSCREMAEVGLW
jgi:hypothetical protein